MPIFEYECKKCGAHFDTLIRNKKEELEVVCEKCGSGRVEKQLSLFGFTSGGKTMTGSKNCSGCSSSNCRTCR